MIREANVFVDDNRHARIADFGLALVGDNTVGRMTTPSSFRGTLEWMTPEHLHDETLRPALPLDVYAFACLCYAVRFTAVVRSEGHDNLKRRLDMYRKDALAGCQDTRRVHH